MFPVSGLIKRIAPQNTSNKARAERLVTIRQRKGRAKSGGYTTAVRRLGVHLCFFGPYACGEEEPINTPGHMAAVTRLP